MELRTFLESDAAIASMNAASKKSEGDKKLRKVEIKSSDKFFKSSQGSKTLIQVRNRDWERSLPIGTNDGIVGSWDHQYGQLKVSVPANQAKELLFKAGFKMAGSTVKEDTKKACWDGYERTPGTKQSEKGSCRPKNEQIEDGIPEDDEVSTFHKSATDEEKKAGRMIFKKTDKVDVQKNKSTGKHFLYQVRGKFARAVPLSGNPATDSSAHITDPGRWDAHYPNATGAVKVSASPTHISNVMTNSEKLKPVHEDYGSVNEGTSQEEISKIVAYSKRLEKERNQLDVNSVDTFLKPNDDANSLIQVRKLSNGDSAIRTIEVRNMQTKNLVARRPSQWKYIDGDIMQKAKKVRRIDAMDLLNDTPYEIVR